LVAINSLQSKALVLCYELIVKAKLIEYWIAKTIVKQALSQWEA